MHTFLTSSYNDIVVNYYGGMYMYYSYDTDENYNVPYSCMPFCPMINNEMMDYDMTREYHAPQQYPQHYPQHQCGPRGRWVPGHWERRWVPGHCEYGHFPGYGGQPGGGYQEEGQPGGGHQRP